MEIEVDKETKKIVRDGIRELTIDKLQAILQFKSRDVRRINDGQFVVAVPTNTGTFVEMKFTYEGILIDCLKRYNDTPFVISAKGGDEKRGIL